MIFAEGMSSEVISEKLTPHTFELRDRSVSFENYYNHTAATFRGIRGQLISGFQLLGGSYGGQGIAEINKKAVDEHFKGRTESLPLILRKNGYQTVFLSPHPESDNFQTFVKGIGFDEVIGSKTAQNGRTGACMKISLPRRSGLLNKSVRFFWRLMFWERMSGLIRPM